MTDIIFFKDTKFLLLSSLRSENSFARSTRDLVRLFVSLWLLNIFKLVNRLCHCWAKPCFQSLGMHAVENGLWTDALVAGFTNISLHTEITSLISFLSGVDNSYLTTKDISLQLSIRLELKIIFNNHRCLRYCLCLLCLRRLLRMLNCNVTPLRTNGISSATSLLLSFIFILNSTKVGVGVGGWGWGLGVGVGGGQPLPCAVPVFLTLKGKTHASQFLNFEIHLEKTTCNLITRFWVILTIGRGEFSELIDVEFWNI